MAGGDGAEWNVNSLVHYADQGQPVAAACWPRPPLRPKRSALRASQGFAPAEANKRMRGCGATQGLRPGTTTGFGHETQAKYKTRKQEQRKKQEHRKGDTSNGIRMGTFLSGLDTFLSSAVAPG